MTPPLAARALGVTFDFAPACLRLAMGVAPGSESRVLPHFVV
jgi:hypothetical protein